MARPKGYKKEMLTGLKMVISLAFLLMAKPRGYQMVMMMAYLLTDSLKEYLLTAKPKDYAHLTGLRMENRLEIQTGFPMVRMMVSLLRAMRWALLMAMSLETPMDSTMAKTKVFLLKAKRMDYDLGNQMANCWVIHLANWKDSPMGMQKVFLPMGKRLDFLMVMQMVCLRSDLQTESQKVRLTGFQKDLCLVMLKVKLMEIRLDSLMANQKDSRWVKHSVNQKDFQTVTPTVRMMAFLRLDWQKVFLRLVKLTGC